MAEGDWGDSVGNNRAQTVADPPIADLLQLPRGERHALAMALCTELDRRWAAHRQNPTAALPWEEGQRQLGLG